MSAPEGKAVIRAARIYEYTPLDKAAFAIGHLRNMIETLKAKCYGPAEAR